MLQTALNNSKTVFHQQIGLKIQQRETSEILQMSTAFWVRTLLTFPKIDQEYLGRFQMRF
jgi:hypothetical protein